MSPPAGPGQRPGGVQGAKLLEALKILYFTVPKMCIKLMHFLPGYCSRNYKNWQTKNISENNFFIFYTNYGVRNP